MLKSFRKKIHSRRLKYGLLLKYRTIGWLIQLKRFLVAPIAYVDSYLWSKYELLNDYSQKRNVLSAIIIVSIVMLYLGMYSCYQLIIIGYSKFDYYFIWLVVAVFSISYIVIRYTRKYLVKKIQEKLVKYKTSDLLSYKENIDRIFHRFK